MIFLHYVTTSPHIIIPYRQVHFVSTLTGHVAVMQREIDGVCGWYQNQGTLHILNIEVHNIRTGSVDSQLAPV